MNIDITGLDVARSQVRQAANEAGFEVDSISSTSRGEARVVITKAPAGLDVPTVRGILARYGLDATVIIASREPGTEAPVSADDTVAAVLGRIAAALEQIASVNPLLVASTPLPVQDSGF